MGRRERNPVHSEAAAACEGGSSARSLPAANSDAVAPAGAGAWVVALRSQPPFLSGILASVGPFSGRVVWVAARTDPASPLADDLASGRACSARDDFVLLSSDRFGRF